MRRLTLSRALLTAALAAAFPFTPAISATSPGPVAQTALTHLKSKGATEIDRRVQNLQGALDKLNSSTKLDATAKATLAKQVGDELAGLAALKTKLGAETTVAGARSDVQSIFADYRVYALMLPKVRMVAASDRFNVVEQKLTDLEGRLQAKVDDAKKAGKDTTAMQKSLDDMQAKIDDAKTKANGVVTQLLLLKPTDYNQNHNVLVSYRASLKTAHDDLVGARDDAKSVIAALGA